MILSLPQTSYKRYPMITLLIITILTTIVGILERVNGPFSLVWLTNAISIGLLLRFYQHVNWRHFLVCTLGMLIPDYLAGTDAHQIVIMTSVNIITIWLAYVCLNRFASRSEENEWLCTLYSVPQWLLLCQPALIGSALLGASGLSAIFGKPFLPTAVFWYLNESLNFIVFLPVILTFPKTSRSSDDHFLSTLRHFLPSALLLFAFIFIKSEVYFLMAAILIIPTLIWLALSGNLFLTTFGISLNGAFFFIWIIHASHRHLPFTENIYLSVVRTIVTVLALCALTIAVAISERDKLFSKLSKLADHDDLTGILNRRAFTKAAEAAISSLKDNHFCTLVLMDIDFFKRINDEWGHQKGDKVLIEFCRRVEKIIPDNQLFARVGGEEFALLLSTASDKYNRELADLIVKEIARTPLIIDNEPFPLTISAGIVKKVAGQKYETLFKYADQVLYQAKNNGRNQCREYLQVENVSPMQDFTSSVT